MLRMLVAIPPRDGSTIPLRIYRAKPAAESGPLPVYLYFHGGGYLFGTLSSEDANCSRIAAKLPIIVVNVCYRHTPQFKHPTQANDAWDAFEWVKTHMMDIGGDGNQLIIGGTSAGAGLAASVVLKHNRISAGRGGIKGQVLCIPWLFHPNAYPTELLASMESGSYEQNHKAPILPRSQVELFTDLQGVEIQKDISIFPGNAVGEDILGMPKTTFVVAGMDVLRDEALMYNDKLRHHG